MSDVLVQDRLVALDAVGTADSSAALRNDNQEAMFAEDDDDSRSISCAKSVG